ncbi:MAG: dTDP-4-dehydrorhamnose 3,5-epimerase [Pirellulales bacterium]|nr:dTDP-4-dehydrorhamnose 3,5-epimerase [Pirellulales bacterium]
MQLAVASLAWQEIFARTKSFASATFRERAGMVPGGTPHEALSPPLRIAGDLTEEFLVPVDQIGLWNNVADLAATIDVVGGASFARLGQTGIVLVEPRVFRDNRGEFWETYHTEKFSQAGIGAQFVQDNHSISVQHVLRGLHYQVSRPQGKLIRAIRGEVFDVAVDLRRSSATFGKWFGTLLSAENRRMMYLPAGFAHGFCTSSLEAEVVYKCTDLYSPEHERTLLWNDATVGIPWPVSEPIVAEKDRRGQTWEHAEFFE